MTCQKTSLFVVLFGQNIFLYLVSKYKKAPIFIPIVFLSLFFHLLTCTNPNTLMDAKQWVKVLFLFLLSRPYIFGNLRTT